MTLKERTIIEAVLGVSWLIILHIAMFTTSQIVACLLGIVLVATAIVSMNYYKPSYTDEQKLEIITRNNNRIRKKVEKADRRRESIK